MEHTGRLLIENDQIFSVVLRSSLASRRQLKPTSDEMSKSVNDKILECLPVGIVVTDAEDRVVMANAAARSMLASEYRIGIGHKFCLPPRGEIKCNQRHVRVSRRVADDNGMTLNIFVLEDVTSLAKELKRLQHQCMSDELTDLYNRRGFSSVSKHFVDSARRQGRKLLLIFADLDGLKKINDTFGHSQGDLAIKDVANILRTSMRTSDVLARVGGDEFVILTTVAQGDEADSVVNRLKSNIAAFNNDNARPYILSVSFGTVEIDPESDIDLMEHLKRADCRMYEHKSYKRLAG